MFENYDEAAEKLRSRKSKILGGGVSEKMFLDKFVIPADLSYSKGWWLSKVGNDDRMFFFVVKDRLSAFDDTIKDILLSHGQKVYQIVCRENDFVIIADGETYPIHLIKENNTAFENDRGRTVYCIPLKEYASMGDALFENSNDHYWGPCQE